MNPPKYGPILIQDFKATRLYKIKSTLILNESFHHVTKQKEKPSQTYCGKCFASLHIFLTHNFQGYICPNHTQINAAQM